MTDSRCPTCHAPATALSVYRCQRCGRSSVYCKCAEPIPTWRYEPPSGLAGGAAPPDGKAELARIEQSGELPLGEPERCREIAIFERCCILPLDHVGQHDWTCWASRVPVEDAGRHDLTAHLSDGEMELFADELHASQGISLKRDCVRRYLASTVKPLDGGDAPAAPSVEECGRCDGVGWYEGGKTLQTTCEKCGGTGVRQPGAGGVSAAETQEAPHDEA